MLKDILAERYTAKWWDDVPVEQSKIDDVLQCAYMAPSKNGKHNHSIYVLTDSAEGTAFKDFLYNENAWCVGEARAPANYTGPNKRRNGQVAAPVVMLWVGNSNVWMQSDPIGENDRQRIRDDCIVSATVAMCAAEELGLQTGFNSMLGTFEICDYLGIPRNQHFSVVAVGMGYASEGSPQNRAYFQGGVQRFLRHPNIEPNALPNAYNLILANKEFIKREASAYAHRQIAQHQPGWNDAYFITKCGRDLNFILNAYLQDLQLGTDNATRTIISNYWYNGELKVVKGYEHLVHSFVKDLIVNYVLTNTLFPALQTAVPQVLDPSTPSEFEAIERMNQLHHVVAEGFNGRGLLVQDGFDLNNVPANVRTVYNRKNRPAFETMIKYI